MDYSGLDWGLGIPVNSSAPLHTVCITRAMAKNTRRTTLIMVGARFSSPYHDQGGVRDSAETPNELLPVPTNAKSTTNAITIERYM